MKAFLEKNIGKKLGMVRLGIPKEIYVEGKVVEVSDEALTLETDEGNKLVIPLGKILQIGFIAEDTKKKKVGFLKDEQ